MNMVQAFQEARVRLLQASPFYGALLTRIPIVEDRSVATACTDGRSIRFNPRFFAAMTPAERNYVLMHELFHVVLTHPTRMRKIDHRLANIAADIIVNDACDRLARNNRFKRFLPMSKPADAISALISPNETLENLYAMLVEDNRALSESERKNKVRLRKNYVYSPVRGQNYIDLPIPESRSPIAGRPIHGPDDLIPGDLSPEEARALEDSIRALVRQAAKAAGSGPSVFMPGALTLLTLPKPLNWRRLLRDMLEETRDDEASYATPERKCLHMDLILPGHGLTEGAPGEVWAFVDSSGSIDAASLNRFLTELYHLVRSTRCTLNLAYWDTSVTDVYTKIASEKKLLQCPPKHSGGTDINCVYNWMKQARVKPDILILLTDGWFGTLNAAHIKRSLVKKTLLVLSDERGNSPDKKKIGRVAILGGK